MVFFIYSRKSIYTGKGDSIENQIELCRKFIALKYPDIMQHQIYVYEDEGFSGKDFNRPKFQQMYNDFTRLNPDFLVCYRLDRISRSIGDFATLFEELNHRNISFLCIKENFDTSTPMGKAMLYITSVFAQLERETIAERVRDNMHQLARTGRWLGGTPPLGFSSEKKSQIVLDGKIKSSYSLKSEPNEQAVVLEIFAQFSLTQNISDVCKHLNKLQMYTRLGRIFSPLSVKEILKNPVYCVADAAAFQYFSSHNSDICFSLADCSLRKGLMVYNKRNYAQPNSPRQPLDKWIVAIGAHLGLIVGAQWVSVQQILTSKYKCNTAPKHTQPKISLLSGKLICAFCNNPMHAKRRSNGRLYDFDYICAQKLNNSSHTCECKNLTGVKTDALVLNHILDVMPPIILSRKDVDTIQRALHPKSLHQIDIRISKCQQELTTLSHSFTFNDLSETFVHQVNQQMKTIEDTLSKLQAERQRMCSTNSISIPNCDDETYLSTLLDYKQTVLSMSIAEQQSLIRALIDHIIWDGVNLHIKLRDD